MPFDRSKYPPDWPERSRRIRERDGNCCQFCGVEQGGGLPSGKRCVLTVMHLDHNPANCAEDNLASGCQPCHLLYDATLHARNAAITRRGARVALGQLAMLDAPLSSVEFFAIGRRDVVYGANSRHPHRDIEVNEDDGVTLALL